MDLFSLQLKILVVLKKNRFPVYCFDSKIILKNLLTLGEFFLKNTMCFLSCLMLYILLSRFVSHFSGMYDGSEHTPKLLPCSHTVCLHCLSRIAASQTRDTGSFRCPICRESITIPRGGVPALPPSFLVNQLLDLMARQRREVVPKCSIHLNQVFSDCYFTSF